MWNWLLIQLSNVGDAVVTSEPREFFVVEAQDRDFVVEPQDRWFRVPPPGRLVDV